MRAFIAIPLPPEGGELVAALGENFDHHSPFAAFRRVPPAKVHLTLRFLGEIPQNSVSEISDLLLKSCAGTGAIPFPVERLGVFPRPGSPSVIWAGPREISPALDALMARLTPALAAVGYPPEARPFRPHLTLARRSRRERPSRGDRPTRRERPPGGLAAALREAEAALLDPAPLLHLTEAVLFKSDLRPEGAVHTPLFRVSLA
jgi:2'-5' RNA ligase